MKAMRAFAGASCLVLAWSASSLAQTPIATPESDEADLRQRVATLEDEIARLRADRGDAWLTEQRSDQIRSLVHDVLADADTRASLLQEGMTAGWNNGFFLSSPDGNFRLKIAGQLQVRYVFNAQDDSPTDDYRSGFENTRTRFGFAGHVFDPSWNYFIWTGFNGSGSTILLDAWIRKDLGHGWAIQAGQFKIPNWQEWLVSETRLQLVERSLLTARYAGLYGQGVQVHYSADDFRVHAAYTDGVRTWNTPWNTSPSSVTGAAGYQQSTEYAFSARGEYKICGDWTQWPDFESWYEEPMMCIVAGSLHYQDGEYGTTDDETELLQWSFDVSFESNGFNVFAAIIGSHFESETTDRDEYGALAQMGYFLSDDWEIFGRYEWGDLDGAGVSNDELSIVTAGVTKFFHKHAVKWTTDIGFALEELDAQWAAAGAGWRADGAGQDGQVVLRSQLQLLF
jgi:hypothetical protein